MISSSFLFLKLSRLLFSTSVWFASLVGNCFMYYDEEKNEYWRYSFKHKYSDKGNEHMIIIQGENIINNEQ